MSKTNRKAEANRVTSVGISVADPNTTGALTGEGSRESAGLSKQLSTDDREESLRALAHGKWEAAGCPPGDGLEFWLEAEREVNAGRVS